MPRSFGQSPASGSSFSTASRVLTEDVLSGARSVVSSFISFDPGVVEARAQEHQAVANEWDLACVETNELVVRVTDHILELLN
jgi:hypothetical protein